MIASWVLVFWIQYPENFTTYTTYDSEIKCKEAEQVWSRRLQLVKSKMQSECRKIEK